MATNGDNASSGFDPTFTQNVIDAMGPKTTPRMRQVMTCLIKHIHDFAREIELTTDEWMEGVQMMNWAGQMSNDRRNEGQLVCDVIGLESLVDEITYKKAAAAKDVATQSAILGPFFRTDDPVRAKGSTISFNTPKDAETVYMYGQVFDANTKRPLQNVSINVWQASTNGLYQQQDDEQVDRNLRGIYKSDGNGEYALRCIKPTPYPVPSDGPAGKLLDLLDRHHYRPAHIHVIALAEGYKPLTTQIFDSASKYLDDDSVFAVKNSNVVDFLPRTCQYVKNKAWFGFFKSTG
ncbi:catechol dioxygenase [Pyrenochaeta sp. DS3sAY3a]|nr:catechol dioxygenase [Pyrenochaeta sp. DS3sAY3a]